MKFKVLCLGALAAIALPVIAATQSNPSAGTAWNGIFSEAQAERGKALYVENCLACHGDANGTPKAPGVMGPTLSARWQKRPVQELFDYIQTRMPFNSPGGLSRTQNADILAFLWKSTGAPAGAKDFVPVKTAGENGTVNTKAPAFYTDDQATRGKFSFDRHCARCHTAGKNVQTLEQLSALHTATVMGASYPMSFGTPYLNRLSFGKAVFPSVYYLFDKLRNMPAFNTRTISDETRADIIAYILKQNDFPAGTEELRPDPEQMKQMMLQEPGFDRMFNGKDLSGIKVVYGPDCRPAPDGGCAKTDTSAVLRVQNGLLVCDCNIHGYWYTDKLYKDFDLRFEVRFIKPADWGPGEDDNLYYGGGGVVLFVHDKHTAFNPPLIEVELRWFDLGDIFPFTQKLKVDFSYDHVAKEKAGRGPFQWNDMRIVSKGRRVETYLNGTLISTITDHAFPAGNLGFQLEGAATEWRNVRVRGE